MGEPLKRLITIVFVMGFVSQGCGPSKFDIIKTNLASGDLETAEYMALEVISADSSSAEGYYYLGVVYERQGNEKKALQAFVHSIKLEPSAEACLESAKIYANNNLMNSAAVNVYAAAVLKEKPAYFDSLKAKVNLVIESAQKAFGTGKRHYRNNEFDTAAKKFQQALQLNKEHSEAKYYLHMAQGLALFHSQGEDNYWEALLEFGEAVNANSKRGEPHYLMAKCYYGKDSNDFDNTIREVNEALKLELDDFYREKAENLLAEVILRKKKLDAFWGRD